ncbi:hypothetical protein MKW98_004767 [Papaver atlanticum]|uniref:Uncharacterized protein n=1 Tax=Papaver atlanticum TaxID=357466 RepID=A0AAD4SPW0_9MAGN|nr:hypothetical protein MKW98_004767 [Papaver atlanticum]
MDSGNLKQETITIVGDHGRIAEMGNSSDALVSLIKEKMESVSPSLCIYIVPEILRKGNENSFEPVLVSIGPFHHGKQGLEAMEKHKWRYLRALLNRKPNLESVLDDCVKAMKQLEQRARKCYEEPINMSSNEFVEMMIVDGCFTIELFLSYSRKELRQRREPIFANSWMLFSVRSDMILLENQLPFFVLQRLFELVPFPKQCDGSLLELAFRFFRIVIPGDDDDILHEKFSREGNHLLDLVRNTYLPSYQKVTPKQSSETLRNIHNYTNNLLRNLIALELCSVNSTMYITSYVLFMDGLIQSPNDVKVLRQHKIITNCLGNDEMVPEFFKKLVCDQNIIGKDNFYSGLCEQVNAYNRRTHKWFNLF